MKTDLSQINVIAPNFKRRLSGVTSTVIRLVPLQARDIAITACAPVLPDNVPNTSAMSLLGMSRRGPSGARVWHARRNTEMLAGLALKYILRKDLKLLFTSASQRAHSGYTKWLIGKMDGLIATSAKTAAYLTRDAEVILHGIDCEAFSPPADRAALRSRLGLPEGLLIGCYGRIRAQKGTGDFVQAMLRLLPDMPEATALVMGRATDKHQSYLSDLKSQVAAAGLAERILFLPEVPVWATPAYYQALDLYIAPQRWEGFGLTPLEAMACGVPVLATHVGAFEELVVEGETGALIPAEDIEAMALRAREILSDPARLAALGTTARAHMEANFRIEREAAAIISVYRRLLAS